MSDARNRYIFCRPDGTSTDVRLDRSGQFDFDDAYFLKALAAMERLGVAGFTFLFVYDARVPLPCTGPDVVVIIYGDERRLVPAYLGEVGAVFTCFGMTPSLGSAPLLTRQGLLETADLARRVAQWLPGGLRRLAQSLEGRRAAPVIRIPMGYQKLAPTPFRPLAAREHLLSFLGSIQGTGERSLKTVLGTPKTASRRALVDVLEAMKADGAPIEIGLTGGYRDSLARGPEAYSRVLMNTRICPVPRGTVLETARYFAAAKFGCVIVAERQPPSRVFENAPALTVRRWGELPGLVAELLADPARMEGLHRASLAWWDEVCAEPVLGALFARSLGIDTGKAPRPALAADGYRLA